MRRCSVLTQSLTPGLLVVPKTVVIRTGAQESAVLLRPTVDLGRRRDRLEGH